MAAADCSLPDARREMGAPAAEVATDIERSDDGSVQVVVSWTKAAIAGDEDSVPGGLPL